MSYEDLNPFKKWIDHLLNLADEEKEEEKYV